MTFGTAQLEAQADARRQIGTARPLPRFLLITVFTLLGFAVMGYHPGLEDDAIYLAAIKAQLHPSLFPHSAEFFRLQTEATLMCPWIATFVRVTSIPLVWAEFLWQLISLFVILWACHGIARHCFPKARAQWAGVAMVAAMLTLPASGTALTLADQYLQPRNLATACILLAIERLLAGRRWQPAVLLALAFLFHPLMAVMGISFCIFLSLTGSCATAVALGSPQPSAAASLPLGWVLKGASPSWREALATRRYYFLYQWRWYEWLGCLAPIFLFWLLAKVARRHGRTQLARFAGAVFAYGIFHQALAMILLAIPALVRVTPLQPMRYLHLVYVFLALMAGCLAGEFLLKASAWRWALYLLAINIGMFASQRIEFAASPHLELPGRQSANPWLQAFDWIRTNTPEDAYFALDPYYLSAPGEDFHGFRALAERSQLADPVKDGAVVTQVPALAPEWQQQVAALRNWPSFQLADFDRLREQFGVSWVLVSYPQPTGLACRWHNGVLSVCRIPGRTE